MKSCKIIYTFLGNLESGGLNSGTELMAVIHSRIKNESYNSVSNEVYVLDELSMRKGKRP